MRQLFSEYANLSQPVREIEPPPALLAIPWGHNTGIIFKVESARTTIWRRCRMWILFRERAPGKRQPDLENLYCSLRRAPVLP